LTAEPPLNGGDVLDKCAFCGGKLKTVNKKRVFDVGDNPGKIIVKCEFYECRKCGEGFYDEEQSAILAKRLDDALKREKRILVPSGSILI